jgi:ubiquinone/menaquinone biosynthesis C-methylase UbiE
MNPIQDYYDKIAHKYDADRFGNSYGRYIDALEREILKVWLRDVKPEHVLDIGCGTGRFLDFAMTGIDISSEMLNVAAQKYPQHRLVNAQLPDLSNLQDHRYQGAFCFHVFMHCDPRLIAQSIQAIAQVVQRGGHLILDIPSRHRRALNRPSSRPEGWHGNTAASYADVKDWGGAEWKIVERRGILFVPIHRLPTVVRPLFKRLDAWIGRTPLARFSSYHVYRLERLG